MTSLAVRIIAAVVGALVLAGLVMFVLGVGPFKKGPSAAAMLQPKVEAKVAKTGAAETAAVGKVETKTQAANDATEKRIETHVVTIRAETRNAPPAAVPDRQFYLSVCSSKLYEGDPNCVGFSGEPESSGSRSGKGALRGR